MRLSPIEKMRPFSPYYRPRGQLHLPPTASDAGVLVDGGHCLTARLRLHCPQKLFNGLQIGGATGRARASGPEARAGALICRRKHGAAERCRTSCRGGHNMAQCLSHAMLQPAAAARQSQIMASRRAMRRAAPAAGVVRTFARASGGAAVEEKVSASTLTALAPASRPCLCASPGRALPRSAVILPPPPAAPCSRSPVGRWASRHSSLRLFRSSRSQRCSTPSGATSARRCGTTARRSTPRSSRRSPVRARGRGAFTFPPPVPRPRRSPDTFTPPAAQRAPGSRPSSSSTASTAPPSSSAASSRSWARRASRRGRWTSLGTASRRRATRRGSTRRR